MLCQTRICYQKRRTIEAPKNHIFINVGRDDLIKGILLSLVPFLHEIWLKKKPKERNLEMKIPLKHLARRNFQTNFGMHFLWQAIGSR